MYLRTSMGDASASASGTTTVPDTRTADKVMAGGLLGGYGLAALVLVAWKLYDDHQYHKAKRRK